MKNSGITCKVWNIKGETATRSTSTQLGDSIGYVLNNEKTDCKLGLEGSPITDPLGQIGRECKYVQNNIKTLSGALVGSKNLFSTNVNDSLFSLSSTFISVFLGDVFSIVFNSSFISLTTIGISTSSLFNDFSKSLAIVIFLSS